jgi:hypothetical protein
LQDKQYYNEPFRNGILAKWWVAGYSEEMASKDILLIEQFISNQSE